MEDWNLPKSYNLFWYMQIRGRHLEFCINVIAFSKYYREMYLPPLTPTPTLHTHKSIYHGGSDYLWLWLLPYKIKTYTKCYNLSLMMCKLIVDILNFILMPWLLFNIIVSSEFVTPKFLKLRYYYTLDSIFACFSKFTVAQYDLIVT